MRLAFKASAVLAAALLTACTDSSDSSKPSAHPLAIPVTVNQVKFTAQPIGIRVLGKVEPSQSVIVKARSSGLLENKHFVEGHRVEKGEPLFQLEKEELAFSLREAQASLAQSNASSLRAGLEYKRIAGLHKARAVSDQELELAVNELQVRKAAEQTSSVAVERAKKALNDASIVAPITGIAGLAQADVGNLIESGTPLVLLQDIDRLHITFGLSQKQFKRLFKNEAAGHVEIDVGSESVNANIDFASAYVDEAVGTVNLRATLENQKRLLIPGQTIDLKVVSSDLHMLAELPSEAVVYDFAGPYVFVVEDNKAVVKRVRLQSNWHKSWFVRNGLMDGDQVISTQLMKIFADAPVAIEPEQPNVEDKP